MVHPCDKPCGNKTASGYCATTACINPQFSNIGTAHYGQGAQKRIVTNADRLRSMSDEELAEFYCNDVDACPPGSDMKCIDELYAHGEGPYPSDKQCVECWLDWLRQEARDD